MQSYKNYRYFSKNSKEMEEARDIVKLALPFTAGALSISCLSLETYHTYHAASLSLVLLSLMTAAMLVQSETGKQIRIIEIILTGFLAGMFIYANAGLCHFTDAGASAFSESAARAGRAMQESIDSIAFRSHNTNAVIKALLTGNRRDIPAETVEAFRSSGASHILALSGLHLGIIYLIVSKLAGLAGGHPKAVLFRSVFCIAICTTYSFATGAGASIIRSLIFVIIGEVTRLLHRKPDIKSTLASSLVIHLSLNPSDISEIGFQLSYGAIAGIAWIFPKLKTLWPEDGEPVMRRIWNSAALSISCQLTTGPIAWLYFGTFPQYFILTNLIAIPLTTLIIPAALLTASLNAMGICPHLLIRATETLVEALCGALSVIAAM